MSTKCIHTLKESREIIGRNFEIIKDVFKSISFNKIVEESKSDSTSLDYLKKLVLGLENPESKLTDLMQKAGKILHKNPNLLNLAKKRGISHDDLLSEGVKLLEESEDIQNLINEIQDNELLKKHTKQSEQSSSENKLDVFEDIKLDEFIKKMKIANKDFNPDDMTVGIYQFFNKYPTKDHLRFPDGTIINMKPNEPAVDFENNILPLKNGIPQGEEATRIVTKNIDTGVIIASPPGVHRTYFITRYGIPKSYGHELEKYNGLKKILGVDFSSNCFFEKFGCSGKVQPIISVDNDSDMNCCHKHHTINACMLNVNIASLSDISQFYDDRLINFLSTNPKDAAKVKILKKIKILLTLADKSRLKNRRLDDKFKLHGIHYYYQYSFETNKPTHGWALIYYDVLDVKKRLCHIYLDELTDDIDVLKTMSCIVKEIILAKYDHDILHIDNFLNKMDEIRYNKLEKIFEKPYAVDMKAFISNNSNFNL
jgi:hypothetical protein